MGEKINLSEATVYQLRGVDIQVYPATLSKIEEVTPMFEKLQAAEDSNNLKEQVDTFKTLVLLLIKDDNPDLSADIIGKLLTMEACVRIVQTALGTMSGLVS